MEKNKIFSKAVSGILLCTMATYTLPVLAYTKDETVYSNINSNGENYSTVVSTHLVNSNGETTLKDMTDLLNIENTEGDEAFTQNGNSLEWKADGNDIYYKGNSQKELPINCKIIYTLNDKEVSANDIVGKSGKVKIKIQYENKDSHKVNINGSTETLYTPFIVMAGTIIKNDNNKNIAVTNGKIVNDGSKTVVAGLAMPGLQESLGVSKDKIDIPDSIEISMDSTDFEMNSIISYVTPKVIDENDITNLNDIDKIFDEIDELQSASNQLVEGTQKLAEGTNTLKTGVNELANSNSDTVTTIGNTAVASATLTSTQKQAIAKQAVASATLTNAQKQAIADQAGASATLTNEQITEIQNQASNLALATINSQETAIESNAKDSIDKLFSNEYLAQIGANAAKNITKLSDEQINNINETVEANIKNADQYKNLSSDTDKQIALGLAQVAAQGAALTAEKQTASAVAEKTALKTAEQVASSTAYTTAQNVAKQTAASTATSVAQNTATTVASKTATTVAQSTATTVASKTATTVAQSTATTVAKQVAQSTATSIGSNLSSGVNEINDGAQKLSEGMNNFNEEGIKKICDYVNGNVKDIKSRIEKLSDLAKEYNKFTMANNGTETSVKFIMIIDEIKKDQENDNSKEQLITNNESNNSSSNEEETSSK